MNTVVSVIDTGSNSVRLMTARIDGAHVTPIDRNLITTRLIHGMHDRLLTDDLFFYRQYCIK